MELTEKMVSSQTIFEGKIIKVTLDQAQLPDGKLASREVVYHPGGVAVLALDEDGTVYLVKQFRYPFAQVVEELPAGKLDGPEDHEKAARRELSEEVGVEADELHYLGCLLASPGFCTEVLHMYFARGLRHGACHPDEDEFLSVERIPFETLYQRVMAGEITDAKTVAITLKVKEIIRREAGESA